MLLFNGPLTWGAFAPPKKRHSFAQTCGLRLHELAKYALNFPDTDVACSTNVKRSFCTPHLSEKIYNFFKNGSIFPSFFFPYERELDRDPSLASISHFFLYIR